MAQEEETHIPGERAETTVGRRIDNNPVLKRGAVALAVVAFVGFAIWSTSEKRTRTTRHDLSVLSFARPMILSR